MDILKNTYLSFNFIKNNILFDNDINLVSLILKLFLFYLLINFNIFKIFIYFKNFINKSINKKSRKILIFYTSIIFLNILIYNLIDLLPNSLIKNIFYKNFNLVVTSNINITFCFSIVSFLIINYLSIKKIGILNFFFFFFKNPIKKKYMFIFNFIIEFISFVMKPVSLSLRLFGNIFSSEIIFNLINNMNLLFNITLNLLWSLFHFIVLPLQAYIFTTLITIYVSQSLKH
ncbi:F0F1 ATP synthase subunit A [Candidatus Carsonella ruddii]|uniref:ATP synthase F0 sector subunit a n=1 Tax=Carsonella ruddii TaxID=114186 RepID=A0A1U9RS66_CARRU|nr:F0F1 ATP synthase subunit A [Candidatus Carsonella ruddii]AQU89421.1 ATP synthase F0 sector subunit a [Candidatus Carsonella ruddii]